MKNLKNPSAVSAAKLYNIEVLRFLFSLIIVYFHILHSNILKFTTKTNVSNIYDALAINCTDGYLIVECFFIIAGFFLFQSFKNNRYKNWHTFTLNKIARLWPVLAFSILITIFAGLLIKSNTTSIYTHFINMLFLQCIGVSLDYRGINWFISPYFWVMIFYFFILKSFNFKHACLIIAICAYFSLVGNINYFEGEFGRETINIFFNSGIMRALFGIGAGYFTGLFYNSVKDLIALKFNDIKSFIIISLCEISIFAFLIKYFIFYKINYQNKLIFVIAFIILFFLFLIKKGCLSKLFENKYLGCLGKYSYSIYIMQQISFWILGITLWKSSVFINNIYQCLLVSILFSVIVGVLTYYLVEKPSAKYLKKKFNI